jgi:hypothetical protein
MFVNIVCDRGAFLFAKIGIGHVQLICQPVTGTGSYPEKLGDIKLISP